MSLIGQYVNPINFIGYFFNISVTSLPQSPIFSPKNTKTLEPLNFINLMIIYLSYICLIAIKFITDTKSSKIRNFNEYFITCNASNYVRSNYPPPTNPSSSISSITILVPISFSKFTSNPVVQ